MADTKKPTLAERFHRAAEIGKKLTPDFVRDLADKHLSVSAWCEREDPSDPDSNLPFDAFERMMMTKGIVMRTVPEIGLKASRLEDVNGDSETRGLMGEIFNRNVRQVAINGKQTAALRNTRMIQSHDSALGTMLNQFVYPDAIRQPLITAAIPVAELLARTEPVDDVFVKPFEINDVDPADVRARIGEGAEIPHVEITHGEKEIHLTKDGIGIIATYEALRRIPVDLLGIFVQRIAVKNESNKVDRIVGILEAGDGNSGTAATNYDKTTLDTSLGAGDPLSLKAWLAFKMKFVNPYMITHVLANEDQILDLMLLNTGSANVPLVSAGSVFAGQSFTPINHGLADNVRTGWLSSVTADTLLGFDARYAVVRYYETGGNIQETTKWVESQREALYLTEYEGYEIGDSNANKTLTTDA